MMTVDSLLERIERYCSDRDIAESTFGRWAVNDGKLVGRLRRGGTVTLTTVSRIESLLNAPESPTTGAAA